MVSPDTLARWIKNTLAECGINTGEYSAHSCRAAATSTASLKGISLGTILKSASWAGDSTFKRYYLKEIHNAYDVDRENMGKELLRQFKLAGK